LVACWPDIARPVTGVSHKQGMARRRQNHDS
jgi:hypothetical protein